MLIEILNNVLYILQFIIVAVMCFRMKYIINRKRIVIVLGSIALITVMLHYVNHVLIQFSITFMCIFGTLLFLIKEKKRFLFVYAICMIMTFSMFNMMIEMMMLSLIRLFGNQILKDINNIYPLLGSLVLLISLGMMLRRGQNKSIRDLHWGYALFFALLLVVNSIVVLSLGSLAFTEFSSSILYNVSYILVVLGIFVQIALIIWFILSREVYREKEMMARRYLESQMQHYSYLENRERETKKFRHDVQSHMQMISHLYMERNDEEFQRYIEEMNGRIKQFGSKVFVDNGIVDAILNQYYAEAEKQGIELKVKGRFPTKCKVSAYDLCTIFSNLLSNAIRAVKSCQGEEIVVACKYDDSHIIIAVENDYGNINMDTNQKLQTSKEDSLNHGFGLENVEACVERNQGYMDINTEKNRFRVLLSLKND